MSACGRIESDPIQMAGTKEALLVDWLLYPGLCELITQNQQSILNRLVGCLTITETKCLQDCHISDCGCGVYTTSCTVPKRSILNSSLKSTLKELIIVRENYFTRSSIRENFTTSICREWSNYIFLCDRNTQNTLIFSP